MPCAVRHPLFILAVAGFLSAAAAYAASPDQLQAEYDMIARKEAPGP